VLRACEVADFAEDGCPKSRLRCKNRKAATSANGWHLNFNAALRKWNGAMGGHQFVRRVPPSLGPLATSSGLFLPIWRRSGRAAARKRL
jgi:hypothetical protein